MQSFLFLLLSILFFTSIGAQSTQSVKIFSTKEEGAIKGYDPVAYFTDNKATKGKKEINLDWNKVTWYFATESNKLLFKQSPEKYVPQYGGYCAYGWAQGYAVKIDPEAWAIENGKLYLNYSKKVQKDWDKDRSVYIKKADENFYKN